MLRSMCLNTALRSTTFAGTFAGIIALTPFMSFAQERTPAAKQPSATTAAAEAPLNALTPAEAADGWQLLFDGSTTSGWTTAGDSTAWTATNGELHTSKPGKGWWLRTTRTFRDFELKLDFKLPPNGNSGVGLRGSSGGDPAFTGFEVQVFDSFGKPLADNVCGAVYNAVAPASQAVKKPGEWNTYHIMLVADELNVFLNGVQIHNNTKLDERGYVHDPKNLSPLRDRLTTGFISLQDHGDIVHFRNIKIKDLSTDPLPAAETAGQWQPLIGSKADGLKGWDNRGTGKWEIDDEGTLIGRDGPGHLFTERTVTDFELRGSVKVNTKGNSGIYFRVKPKKEDPNTWPDGFEAQVDQHDPKNFTGCVYNMAWPSHLSKPSTRDNAWFDYRIRAEGNRIRTWINGVRMVDATLDQFKDGHIALQTHHVGNTIMYRDLRILDLAPAAAPQKVGQ